jgi:hypothetical protein
MTRSAGSFTVGPLSAGTIAIRAAAALLGAGCVAWAFAPPVHKGFANLALILAIGGVAAGTLRLALAGVPEPADSFLLPAPIGHQQLVDYLRTILNVTNVLIADGASHAENLAGVPILNDPAGDTSQPSAVFWQATQKCRAPAAPTGLKATANSAVQVSLRWNAVSPSGTGCSIASYQVVRGKVTITTAVTTYTDTSVAADTKYTYRVRGVATGGIPGALSAVATVTTP